MPTSASNVGRSETLSLVDALARVSDNLDWSKSPEMAAFAVVTGRCTIKGLLDTRVSGRDVLRILFLSHNGAWAQVMRKILDS